MGLIQSLVATAVSPPIWIWEWPRSSRILWDNPLVTSLFCRVLSVGLMQPLRLQCDGMGFFLCRLLSGQALGLMPGLMQPLGLQADAMGGHAPSVVQPMKPMPCSAMVVASSKLKNFERERHKIVA